MVKNSGREKHGALLDSELLSDVYLELIGGRQPGLVLRTDKGRNLEQYDTPRRDVRKKRKTELKSLLTDVEVNNLTQGTLNTRNHPA